MTCEVCEKRPADREVVIEKESKQDIILRACPYCALFLVGYERLP
jgi:hypothetical protein